MTQPIFLIAGMWTGSTLLASQLSTHPDIAFYRQEPLNENSSFRRSLGLEEKTILTFVLEQPFHRIAGCKILTCQMTPGVESFLRQLQPKLVLLRRNPIAYVVSMQLAQHTREWHRTEPGEGATPPRLVMQMDALERDLQRIEQDEAVLRKLESEFDSLRITYDEIVSRSGKLPLRTRRKIFSFLGIASCPMVGRVKRIRQEPLSKTVKNYSELETYLKQTDRGHLLP